MVGVVNSAATLLGEMTENIELHLLGDDGLIPNNGALPLVIYRQALKVPETGQEEAIQQLFQNNGWDKAWVNGIYSYHHYHSTAHEILGIARGRAEVQLGGPDGVTAVVQAGDAILIPAGVGHCLVTCKDLVVVGSYPKGQDWDLCRAIMRDRKTALANLPHVPLPETDPVFGGSGPVHEHWRK